MWQLYVYIRMCISKTHQITHPWPKTPIVQNTWNFSVYLNPPKGVYLTIFEITHTQKHRLLKVHEIMTLIYVHIRNMQSLCTLYIHTYILYTYNWTCKCTCTSICMFNLQLHSRRGGPSKWPHPSTTPSHHHQWPHPSSSGSSRGGRGGIISRTAADDSTDAEWKTQTMVRMSG